MNPNPSTALQGADRFSGVVNNQRVTAHIVLDEEGEPHTVYQVAGRSYDSLTALADAIGERA